VRKIRIVLLLFVLLSASWVVLQSTVRLINYGDIRAAWSGNEQFVLDRPRFPGGPLFRALKEKLAPGEWTLVFRQSDFTLYGTGRWLSDWDTAAKPLYQLTDAAAAFRWLRQRQVRFALMPNYLVSTYYRTAVGQVLSDLRYVEPLGEHSGYRLLRLRDAPVEDTCKPVDLAGFDLRFADLVPSFQTFAWLAGLARFDIASASTLATRIGVSEIGARSVGAASLSARWAAGRRIQISTGRGPISYAPNEPQLQLGPGVSVVRAAIELSGQGLVGINVLQYLANWEQVSSQQWDGVVDGHKRLVAVLFKPIPEARSFRIVLTNLGRSPGFVSGSALSICRSAGVGAVASLAVPAQYRPLRTWSVKDIAANCVESARGNRGGVGAIERTVDSIRVVSNWCVLGTHSAVLDWRFEISAVTEPWRIYFENHPESRLASLALPVLYRLISPEPTNASINIEARVRAKSDGGMNVYVQWRRRDGRMQTKLIGGTSHAAAFQEYSFPASVPGDAGDLELIVAVNGTGIEIGDMAISRPASLAIQPAR